jgi:hypothetical protein
MLAFGQVKIRLNNKRGTTEQRIKEGKKAVKWTGQIPQGPTSLGISLTARQSPIESRTLLAVVASDRPHG